MLLEHGGEADHLFGVTVGVDRCFLDQFTENRLKDSPSRTRAAAGMDPPASVRLSRACRPGVMCSRPSAACA